MTTTSNPDTTPSTATPVLIDLGKKSQKQVKRLRKGKGKLLRSVQEAIQKLTEGGQIAANAQPIIVVVRERTRSYTTLGW